ncbi:MAG: substrate-binding domain-containing protein [Microcoleaceae cyanobacterium]
MQQGLKRNSLIFLLGAIAFIGLPSCSTGNRTTSTSTASENQAEVNAIRTGTSSSTVDFLRVLTIGYESTDHIGQVMESEPGQSESAIAGVNDGLLEIGAISSSLKPGDRSENVNYRQVAQDALVVATHPSVTGVTNLTTEELKGIYSGQITNWKELGGPDAQIVLLDRPEDESAKRLLREHYLGQDLPCSPEAVVLLKEVELIATLEDTPHSIGAFSLAYALSHDLPVNRLSLNDIEPNAENMKAGQYSMARTIGLVWNKDTSEATQDFVEYVFSPAGAEVMEQAGFSPLTQSAESTEK